jgi:putative transposase
MNHKIFPLKRTFAWQIGYTVFAVSPSQKQTVLDYIGDQQEHHRKLSFKDEFLAFLRKHEIEYDEKYLWE